MKRLFSADEDDLVRSVCCGDKSISEAARQLGSSGHVVRRRVRDLGLSLPQYFRDISRMGRPKKLLPPEGGEEPPELDGPLSVGEDLYLKRLWKFHFRPRDEVYPGSESKRPVRHLRRVA